MEIKLKIFVDRYLLNHDPCGESEALPSPALSIDSQIWTALEEPGEAHPQGISTFPLPELSWGYPHNQEERESQQGSSFWSLSVNKVDSLLFLLNS